MQNTVAIGSQSAKRADIIFHAAERAPQDVLDFWRANLGKNDISALLSGSPEWFAMMAMGNGGGVCALYTENGLPRAVFPYLFRTWRPRIPLPGAVRLVEKIPVAVAAAGGFIGDGLTEDDTVAIINALYEKYPAVQAIRFDRVFANDAAGFAKLAARCNCFIHDIHDWLPHYYLVPPPSWQDYRARYSSRNWKRMERYARSLEREADGKLSLQELRDTAAWQAVSGSVEKLVNKQAWQADALGHRINPRSYLDAARRGFLRSFLLLAGELPVAFQLAFQAGGVLVLQQTGFDARYAKFGPGTIMHHKIVERLYKDPANMPAYVDYGVGEADYKKRFANHALRVRSLMLVRNHWRLRWRLTVLAKYRALRRTAAGMLKLRKHRPGGKTSA